ncbi:Threonine dehydrogenase [Chryseobacterium wanjuense]|jgi:threonine dehydrogenase-like Zn-dependent dehydrogenase|uniref:Threonine dehydrogenase n=1 Tax=Chryseobacterium wanjuense TaxID=356305 RepID=A0A1I0Q6K8_9FLAO|nr:alcohol dehydrogenase catalytic domain-containing protein [Chryseobacterium wanjuense]SEW22601.1 Threonine dehydrogenase [Chryseobacterium wanjuense]
MNSHKTIPEVMKAIVAYAPHDYRLEEVPVPKPGPGEILVKVKSAGICASDIKCYTGAPLFWGDENRTAYCEAPVIPGHEFVGEVVELGEGAKELYHLEIGDHAVSEQIVPCGECRYCKNGHYWMCNVHDIYGFHQRTQGAWAEYMLFPKGAFNFKVPKSIPLHHAAFIEPLACSIHAVERGDIKYQDTVVIAGCGPLGLGMFAAAKMKSPARIIALDMQDERLELALRSGADIGINVTKENAVKKVLELTDGYGCDVYIEATGHPSAVEQGLNMIRKMGTFVEFSVMREKVTVDWTIIGDTKELNIHGSHLGPNCYPVAIRMLEQGLLPMEEIVTHKFPLTDYQKAIDLVADGLTSVKVTLEP